MAARERLRKTYGAIALTWWIGVFVIVILPVTASLALRKTTPPIFSTLLSLAPFVVGGGTVVGIIVVVLTRRSIQKKQDAINEQMETGAATILLLPRRDGKPVDVTKVALMSRLADVLFEQHISLEVSGGNESIVYSLRAHPDSIQSLLTHFRSEWEGIATRPVDGKKEVDPLVAGKATYFVEIGPTQKDPPITAEGDPLRALLIDLAGLPAGMRGGLQVLVRADNVTRGKLARKAEKLTAAGAQKGGAMSRGQTTDLGKRAARLFVEASVRVWVTADSIEDARTKALSIAQNLCAQYGPENPIQIGKQGTGSLAARAMGADEGRPWADNEITTLVHMVGEDAFAEAPMLRTASARDLPPSGPVRVPSNAHVMIGNGDIRPTGKPTKNPARWMVLGDYTDRIGNSILVGMPMPDLMVHTMITGTTGSGKSTLMTNLVTQTKAQGAAVFIVDPHGDLCDDSIKALPASQLADVVLLDLNGAAPPAFNLLGVGLGASRAVAVDTAMSCLKVSEPTSWDQSTRMREVLRHALHILIDGLGAGASLIALHRFLNDADYREWVFPQCSSEVEDSTDYWLKTHRTLAQPKGGADIRSSILAANRRLSLFLEDERFRRSLALPSLGPRINVREFLAGNRMVLAPIKIAEMGEQQGKVFGTLLMRMVTSAFLGRSDKADRKQAVIIIDEFAAVAGSEIGGLINILLAQARKFGASVMLATQSLSQLPKEVQLEVNSNTNNKIILAVSSPDDAKAAVRTLASEQLKPVDMLTVPRFHGYARVMVDRAGQPPFLMHALAPIELADNGHAGQIQVPATPSLSGTWKTMRQKAERDPYAGIDFLVSLDDETFQGVVADQMAYGQYAAAMLLAEPQRTPDKLKRAQQIGGFKYGLPWWMRESYYKRMKRN